MDFMTISLRRLNDRYLYSLSARGTFAMRDFCNAARREFAPYRNPVPRGGVFPVASGQSNLRDPDLTMRHCRPFILGLLLPLCVAPALADPAIETVQVTSARLPAGVGDGAFSVTALSADQLAQSDRLDDALEQVPGLSLFRRSGSENANATTQGISLRDIAPSGAGRTAVLLDGVPLNDPFGGWVIWGALPYEDIGGADVVRGAGTGPYGSGALTGTILLTERDTTNGLAIADAAAGSLGTVRTGASGGTQIGNLDVFASAAGERSNGWIPIDPPRRGLADNHLWLDSGEASLRAQEQLGGGVVLSARTEYYDDARGGGILGVTSQAKGWITSVTLARPADASSLGWRIQTWMIDSGFANTSASVPAFPVARNSAIPANDQYATPALGLGGNAALVGTIGHFRWEAGGDLRVDQGESRELYSFSSALQDFTSRRRSGGMLTVGGLYGEGAYDDGNWLLTLGVRADYWATAQGHIDQYSRAPNALTSQTVYQGRDGVIPTARAGVRRSLWDDQYLRIAAYEGFRAPTLNELYRPFRVGNNTTQANGALKPEELYGAEVGLGGARGTFTWNMTGFYNELHDAVANVTIASSTAGVTFRRENAGDVKALGLEGDAAWQVDADFALRAAFSITDARVHPDPANIQIAGNRPAQAPPVTITAGATWLPLSRLKLDADLHWEAARFEDDQNTMLLGSAFVLDLKAAYRLVDAMSVFISVENATKANIATAEAADGTISYGQPRVCEVGLSYAP
jgi:outer membrane receptor protein involved in Fe transport